MISLDAIKKILGIENDVDLEAHKMIGKLNFVFYPNKKPVSDVVSRFAKDFESSIKSLGIKISSHDSMWERVPFTRRVRRFLKYSVNNIIWLCRDLLGLPTDNFLLPIKTILKLSSKYRIRKGVTIVCIGEQNTEDLAMQYISSFKTNSIITIVDLPNHIKPDSDFTAHFDTSMSLFSFHMTNIIIAVDNSNWITYNFNASHPSFKYPDGKMEEHILSSIVPKIAAPISPHKLNEFIVLDSRFDPNGKEYKEALSDMVEGAYMFDKTKLFPNGKSIDDLPFRCKFHKHIGKLHLDNRSGMSFGFLAYQLPSKLHKPDILNDFRLRYPNSFINGDIFVDDDSVMYFLHQIGGVKFVIRVPEVWVLTLRSGANKTSFDIKNDIIKLGLINGKMYMQLPKGLVPDNTYKPSFDTKVILSHAVCNSLIASLSQFLGKNKAFVGNFKDKGISISHWHGYFNKQLLPNNVVMYGSDNLHVSCSSPQSSVYAFQGKFKAVFDRISELENYEGDIHIEPHHGINVNYSSLVKLADYILSNPGSTELGNKYL